MPARDNIGLRLSQVHELGNLVRVRCNLCQRVRHYHAADMITLLGDAEVDALRRRLKCEDCGERDYVELDAPSFTASERVRVTVRRLLRARIIRCPVWRNERM